MSEVSPVARWLLRLPALLYALAIAGLTLWPQPGPLGAYAPYRGSITTADIVANLLLFAPLGASLRLGGLSMRQSAAVAAAFSAVIEVSQIFLPGRFPSPLDIVMDGLGALLGAALVEHSRRFLLPVHPQRALLSAVAAVLAWQALAGFALVPTRAPGAHQVGFTPSRIHVQPYRGEVLEARLGGLPLRDGPVSPEVMRALDGDAPLSLTLKLGERPEALSAVLDLVDSRLRPSLMVGVVGDDVVVDRVVWGARLRLSRPPARAQGLLAGLKPGAVVRITTWLQDTSTCIQVEQRRVCGLGPTLGTSWGLLRAPHGMPPHWAGLLDLAWPALLLFPLGLYGRAGRETIGALALFGLGCALGWVGTALVRPGLVEALASALGLALGQGVYQLARWWCGRLEGRS